MKNTIVFIHGMFQNPKSWEKWMDFFVAKGYNCLAPAWPLHEGDPAFLRENPSEELGKLSLEEVVAKIETLVYSLPEKPIVIGHSVGGLIVQRLANLDMIKAGIAISSVAPNGMIDFSWPFIKNAATIANPIKGNDPIYMDLETFQGSFANTLSDEEAPAAFAETAVHDSRNIFRDCMGEFGKLDIDIPHPPLLFVAGEKDQICPADLVEKNAKAYTDGNSTVAYEVFPERSHYICNEPGWEEVASSIEGWLQTQQEVVVEEPQKFL
ncbi:alpha/beta hydrolase [Pedobacter sp. L105]|uniref:alpha/beta hydrolase n=1 Tax=Pedobacter sp. L105 TaxID=1641871 RepID=UPI00131E6FFD|nr:alpha/beta hydrolase [Pedobacter sp. L105]